jgi:hypothetical protein
MPKINGNQITPGTVIYQDGGLWVAVKTNAVKPGKGGAFNQVETAARKRSARTRAAGYRQRRKDRRRYERTQFAAGELDGQATALP